VPDRRKDDSMALYPLIITPEVTAAIQQHRTFAANHRLTLLRLRQAVAGQVPSPDKIAGYHILLPTCYICSFTIEEQPHGWSQHISVSLKGGMPNRGPTPVAMEEIISHYGFPPFKSCHIWTDPDPRTRTIIIHMMALLTDCNAGRPSDMVGVINA
jgi:hypothetical protein